MRRAFLSLLFSCWLGVCYAQSLVGDGVTDNKPIWDQLVSNTCASQDRKISIPMGRFRFVSEMNPIPCSLQVQGQGIGISVFKFDYTGTNGYWVTGGIDPYSGGSLRDVSITVGGGHTIGFAVHIQASLETNPNVSSHNPHGWLAENVLVARYPDPPFTGSFNYGFYLDGEANASPPAGVAPGIRYIRILFSSVSAFNILPALAFYAKGSVFAGFFCPFALGSGQLNVVGIHDDGSTYVMTPAPCSYVSGGP